MELKLKRRFTEDLHNLIVVQKNSLKEALEIICGDKTMGKTGSFLLEQLKKGESLSTAMYLCPYIHFDKAYISFIGFSEKTGRLEETMSYLKKKCDREYGNFCLLMDASIYPLFVICLSVVMILGLFVYWKSMAGEIDSIFAENLEFGKSIFIPLVFLLLFSLASVFVIKKCFSRNELFEAFLAVSYLCKSGTGLSSSVGIAVNILDSNSKARELFAAAKENLVMGLDLKNAFLSGKWKLGKEMRSRLESAFFFSKGSESDDALFEKIAGYLNENDDKKRKICLRLIEPGFIAGTGIFLMLFFMNLLMPLMGGLVI